MNAMAQLKEVSRVVEQTDDNAPRESAFSPAPTVRSQIYSPVSNGKCVQAGKDQSPWQQVQHPWRESWKPFWALLTRLGMSTEL